MNRQLRKERVQLQSLLKQREQAVDARQRKSVEKDVSNLVLRPLKLYTDGETTAKVAELADGLSDLALRGAYSPDMSPDEAVKRVAAERQLDVSDVPANVKERLAKLL